MAAEPKTTRQLTPMGEPQVGGLFRGTDGKVYVLIQDWAFGSAHVCADDSHAVSKVLGLLFFRRLEDGDLFHTYHFKVVK